MKEREYFLNNIIKNDDSGVFNTIIRDREKRVSFNKMLIKLIARNRDLLEDDITFMVFDNEGASNYVLFKEILLNKNFKAVNDTTVEALASKRADGNNHLKFSSFIFLKIPLNVLSSMVNEFRDLWRMSSNIFNHFEEKDMPMEIKIDNIPPFKNDIPKTKPVAYSESDISSEPKPKNTLLDTIDYQTSTSAVDPHINRNDNVYDGNRYYYRKARSKHPLMSDFLNEVVIKNSYKKY